MKFENSLVDDFIIAKSDGWPTYNFAVVVDDFTMKISHVIRAEEHLSNTPKQLLIYDALGFTPPHFAHVSMILAPDRSKLSKRHGATSVQEFRDQGYLPESLVNYLALLGWSPGEDKDILSISEMIEKFDLDHISKSAAIYDIKKLTWMNGHYLAQADINVVLALINDDARARGWLTDNNKDHFVKVIDLVRTRVKTVTEILDDAKYFFTSIDTYDEKGLKKYFMKSGAREKLGVVLDIIDKVTQFNSLELEDALREQAEIMGIKASELIHPTRLAISGRRSTPGLFEVMELLGKNTCNERIKVAINYIDKL